MFIGMYSGDYIYIYTTLTLGEIASVYALFSGGISWMKT